MHNNKTVLDDAVDSLSRKIIRSIMGTACVVGGVVALGAANMLGPDALLAAVASWRSDATHIIERASVLASGSVKAAPVSAPASATAPPAKPIAPPPRTMVAASAAPVAEGVLSFVPPLTAYVPASIKRPSDLVLYSAPADAPKPPDTINPFEVPKPAEAYKPFEPLEPVEFVTPPQAAKPAPVAVPVQAAKPVEAPALSETPRVVLPNIADVPLPLPRPPKSPAQELGLEGKEREKAEKCLAQAVYFEARNEPVRGQIAVAQVVLNRVFSPYYPSDVCSVVYQNAHRLLSCQFTFACDGHPESIRERGAWARAQRIARQTLDGQLWLPEVAKSTHYHASYVRPNWVREMKTLARHGLHTFYRPHRWGDGSDEAGWGRVAAAAAKKP